MTHTWGWYNASDGNVPDNQNRGQVRVRAAGLTSGLGGVHLPTQLHGERAHAVPAVCRVAHGPADLLAHRGRTGGVDDVVSLCRCVVMSFRFFLSFSLHHRFLTVQAHQVFAPWVQNTVRLYPNETAIEIEYTVGPIPFEDGLGKEIVSIWSTGVCLCCLTCVHHRHAVGRGVVHGLERTRHAEARVQLPPHVEAQRHRPVSPCNIVFITFIIIFLSPITVLTAGCRATTTPWTAPSSSRTARRAR